MTTRNLMTLATAVSAVALLAATPAAAESRSYAVSSFTLAAANQDGDCSQGLNPPRGDQEDINLLAAGYTKEQVAKWKEGDNGAANAAAGNQRAIAIRYRAKVGAEPVSVWVNPAAAKDPQLHLVDGKLARGFNLDGKGAASPNGFEDAVTHEKGVNNQLFRAMGCFTVFRGDDKIKPTAWISAWDIIRAGVPAWLITVSGSNLDADGKVSVTFDRALEHVERDAKSEVLQDMTFRVSPDPRSHMTFAGEIKDGVLSLTEHGELHTVFGEEMLFPELILRNVHMRLKINKNGTLSGLIGGYQPWKDTYSSSWYANGGSDQVGLYYLLRSAADANPDPKTGANRDISTGYDIEAVPAFAIPALTVTAPSKKVATR